MDGGEKWRDEVEVYDVLCEPPLFGVVQQRDAVQDRDLDDGLGGGDRVLGCGLVQQVDLTAPSLLG